MRYTNLRNLFITNCGRANNCKLLEIKVYCIRYLNNKGVANTTLEGKSYTLDLRKSYQLYCLKRVYIVVNPKEGNMMILKSIKKILFARMDFSRCDFRSLRS